MFSAILYNFNFVTIALRVGIFILVLLIPFNFFVKKDNVITMFCDLVWVCNLYRNPHLPSGPVQPYQ